jgi:hypothetical protein
MTLWTVLGVLFLVVPPVTVVIALLGLSRPRVCARCLSPDLVPIGSEDAPARTLTAEVWPDQDFVHSAWLYVLLALGGILFALDLAIWFRG